MGQIRLSQPYGIQHVQMRRRPSSSCLSARQRIDVHNESTAAWGGGGAVRFLTHQGFDLRMHINQRLHYLCEENMQEIRTLYYQPGAQ